MGANNLVITPGLEGVTPRAALSLKPVEEGGSSYVQILRSSALIGGSTLLGVAVAVIRTKAMAVMPNRPASVSWEPMARSRIWARRGRGHGRQPERRAPGRECCGHL